MKAKIYGPDGNPDAKISPKPVTMVPWEEVQREERRHQQDSPPPMPDAVIPSFQNNNAVMRTWKTPVLASST